MRLRLGVPFGTLKGQTEDEAKDGPHVPKNILFLGRVICLGVLAMLRDRDEEICTAGTLTRT